MKKKLWFEVWHPFCWPVSLHWQKTRRLLCSRRDFAPLYLPHLHLLSQVGPQNSICPWREVPHDSTLNHQDSYFFFLWSMFIPVTVNKPGHLDNNVTHQTLYLCTCHLEFLPNVGIPSSVLSANYPFCYQDPLHVREVIRKFSLSSEIDSLRYTIPCRPPHKGDSCNFSPATSPEGRVATFLTPHSHSYLPPWKYQSLNFMALNCKTHYPCL